MRQSVSCISHEVHTIACSQVRKRPLMAPNEQVSMLAGVVGKGCLRVTTLQDPD